MGKTICSYSKW